jgi:hypothetical protein
MIAMPIEYQQSGAAKALCFTLPSWAVSCGKGSPVEDASRIIWASLAACVRSVGWTGSTRGRYSKTLVGAWQYYKRKGYTHRLRGSDVTVLCPDGNSRKMEVVERVDGRR